MRHKLAYLYLICIVAMLPLIQAAAPTGGSELEQYQKVVEETRSYRSFGYEEGAQINFDESNSFLTDKYGYTWFRIDGNTTRMYRFNGTAFQDMFRGYPKAERDSLQDLKTASDGSLYVTSSHYLYKWEGYKFTKYAFPKDDRMTDVRIQFSAVRCYGVNGYSILRNGVWKYYKIPITQNKFKYILAPSDTHNPTEFSKSRHGVVVIPYNTRTIDRYNRMIVIRYDYSSNLNVLYANQGKWDSLFVMSKQDLERSYQHKNEYFSVKLTTSSDGDTWLYLMDTNLYYKIDTSTRTVSEYQYPRQYRIMEIGETGEDRFALLMSADSLRFIGIGATTHVANVAVPIPQELKHERKVARIFYNGMVLDQEFNRDTSERLNFNLGERELFRINMKSKQLERFNLPNYSNSDNMAQDAYDSNYEPNDDYQTYSYSDPHKIGLHDVYLYNAADDELQHRIIANTAKNFEIISYNPTTNTIITKVGKKLLMIPMSQKNILLKEWKDKGIGHSMFEKTNDKSSVYVSRVLAWPEATNPAKCELYKQERDSLRFLFEYFAEDFYNLDQGNNLLFYTINGHLNSCDLKTLDQHTINTNRFLGQCNGKLYTLDKNKVGQIWAINKTNSQYQIVDQFSLNEVADYFEISVKDLRVPLSKLIDNLYIDVLSNNELFVYGDELQVEGSKNDPIFQSLYYGHMMSSKQQLSDIPIKVETSNIITHTIRFPSFIYNIKTKSVTLKPYWCKVGWNDQVYVRYFEQLKDRSWRFAIRKYGGNGQAGTAKDDFLLPINPADIRGLTVPFDDNSVVISESNRCLYYKDGIKWIRISLPDDYLSGVNLMSSCHDRIWLSKRGSNEILLVLLLTKSCFRYTGQDGIPEDIEDINADDKGQLYIITADGLYKLNQTGSNLKLNIPWLTVNRVNYDPSKALRLSSKQNNLTIPIDILNVLYPEKCQLEYRLVGFDDTWQKRGYTAQVEYAKLRPGKYRFEVRCLSADGVRSELQSFDVRILPPWYNTWWAYLLYVLIFATVIGAIYRLRTRQLLQRTVELEHTVRVRTIELEDRTAELEDRQKRIQDAIEYASVIQSSILPQKADLQQAFAEYFTIWKPRDVVGGDFYWLYSDPASNEKLIGIIDCTGHSVPGALLSMTVNSILKSLVIDRRITSPAMILHELHREIGATLHQDRDFTTQDGMEIAILKYSPELHQFSFSGAGLNLIKFELAKGVPELIRGNRHGIGGLKWHSELIFDEVIVPIEPNSRFYLYSDGIIDQPDPLKSNNRRLGNADWIALIGSIAAKDMRDQELYLLNYLQQLLEFHEQRDDITIVGIVPEVL